MLNKGPEQRKGKRLRKEPLRLSYDRDQTELDKKFVHSKKTTVTSATWAKYSRKQTTLPEDQQMDTQDNLFKLFHRPHVKVGYGNVKLNVMNVQCFNY